MNSRDSGRFTARGRIFDDITGTIGATPLVRLSRLAAAHDLSVELLAKCEFFNPLSSVKDRIGLSMIDAFEVKRKPGAGETLTFIEPTSGNTGIALAFICAARAYRLILCMPESMSLERRKILTLLGAELVLTPASEGMKGAIARAAALQKEIPGSIIPQQFRNPANPETHRENTAEEIWTDTDGRIDVFVSGVGTGGTITGAGRLLKERNPSLHVVAVEPEDSAVLSGRAPGPHKIQGIGAGFVPDILDRGVIDQVITIGNEAALRMARECARIEGMPVGISSGAALCAAVELGHDPVMRAKRMVVILPSAAERYLSTDLFEGI